MSPKRMIGLFLSLTVLFTGVGYYPILSAGTLSVHGGLMVLVVMWSPGLAAILTRLIAARSVRGMGWRLGKAKWLVVAYLLPVAYALPVYATSWMTGLAGFPNPHLLEGLAEQYTSTSQWAAAARFVAVSMTLGMIQSMIFAVGEEIGWRGLLVPELAKITSFRNTALISGVIWALWHMPGVFFADYNSGGTPVAYSAVCFTVLVVGISFPFAWLTLRSGSLWPAAVLHASHNLFIQGVLDQLTDTTELTPYVLGEFGAGLALAGLVVAFVFRRPPPSDASASPAHSPAGPPVS